MKLILNIILTFLTGGLWLIVLLIKHLITPPKIVIKDKRHFW